MFCFFCFCNQSVTRDFMVKDVNKTVRNTALEHVSMLMVHVLVNQGTPGSNVTEVNHSRHISF